ncbi:MAG: hypothetical protein E7641_07310 [Ruminococcaceae bacterium]|nr:hypothetical protein [Oscillospiraceae bacterium]
MSMNKRPEFTELMRSMNIEKWPESWVESYDRVMEDYEKNGCRLADPSYYDELEAKYEMLTKYLPYYKEAAAELAKNDALCRVTMLICESMKDREHINEEIKQMDLPKTDDGSYRLEYEMLTSLVMTSMADYTYGLLKARNIPDKYLKRAMARCDVMIDSYRDRNEGRIGSLSWNWYQLAIDAKLFYTGRLEIEVGSKFTSKATVFENGKGDIVTLTTGKDIVFHRDGYVLGSRNYDDPEGSWTAEITETDDAWCGYAYDDYGRAVREKVTLKKSEWHKLIEPGDSMVALHIPPGGGMTDESVTAAFAEAKEFMAAYYPDMPYKGFVCGSWLIDKQLIDLLGEDKNISKFCKRFIRVGMKSGAMGVMFFVFMRAHSSDISFEELPENTTLEKVLKRHYLDGKAIYEVYGYIPNSRI